MSQAPSDEAYTLGLLVDLRHLCQKIGETHFRMAAELHDLYRYLNDATEAGAIRDLIMPILLAEVAEITPKLIERKWLKKGITTSMV
jgi:hypothetical protein